MGLISSDLSFSEQNKNFTEFHSKLIKKRKIINVINAKTDTNTRWPNKTVT